MKPVNRIGWGVFSLLALLWIAADAFAQPAKIHVLILSGQGQHDWRATTPFLRQVLTDTGAFEVRVCETPAGLSAETLAPFDVLVDNYAGPSLGSGSEKATEAFVKSGKGLVVVNGALDSFPSHEAGQARGKASWPAFTQMTKVQWPTQTANSLQGSFRLLEGKMVRPEHPVVQGLKSSFRTADAPYHGMTLLPGAEVLATTQETAGKDEPLLIASSYGKGRVFCTLLGSSLASMQEPAFITTLARGTEWAATGKVSLPPAISMFEPSTNAVRVLVITGGHDHYASFYSLFEGYHDLGRVAVSDSKTAFQADFRAKFDVVVMYDFTRDLEDKEKKNLRDFVESNKGVVVLHHGILNFQKWPWWSEEVVGGRYRLSREGNIPNSSVKMDQEEWITPVGNHPITAGVGPFRVFDETYKGLFIATNIVPILATDNPTSDPVVGWIGPCKTSRVVFIQLGHDHRPAQHPAYRTLVHNSILWTADRLK